MDTGAHSFPPCRVAGIAASAGGVTALQALFAAMPGETGLAFVVVMHSQNSAKSSLRELLCKWSGLPTLDVREGLTPAPGRVYLAPYDANVMLHDDGFHVTACPEGKLGGGWQAADNFFESLARVRGEQAIAVVLSGAGHAGALGAAAVRRAGGLVLVQEPGSALYPQMPTAAIEMDAANGILMPSEIAVELAACARPDYVRPASADPTAISRSLEAIIDRIRCRIGFDLSGYRTTPLLSRVQRRMDLRRTQSLADYETLLDRDANELSVLLRDIPIHVTAFFRDDAAWDALQQLVVEPLFEERDHVRAWTPACSSGEECYSLAMLLNEQARRAPATRSFQCFATDASPDIVARASHGHFRAAALDPVSPERRRAFFHPEGDGYRARNALRHSMVFAVQHLLSDPPLPDMDLITCRNLLIYLEPDAASRAVALMHAALRPGGFLFLGNAENIVRHAEYGFTPVCRNAQIYRKTGEVALVAPARRVSHFTSLAMHTKPPHDDDPRDEALKASHEELEASREELHAVNEELRAANVQLNTNIDELAALNVRLSDKVNELQTQNENLRSGEIMLLCLDGQLRMTWFTRSVGELFPVLQSDVGRPLTDFAPKFQDPSFLSDIKAVLGGEPLREGEFNTSEGRWFMRRVRPLRESGAGAGVALTFTEITERKRTEEALVAREAWLDGQRQALEAALNNQPLEASLGELVRAAGSNLGGGARSAFYLANAEGTELHHVVGMPPAYAQAVDGFKIGPMSLACGLATHTGEPVLTADVTKEPRWRPWLSMAKEFDYRGCWSFPIYTTAGNFVGTFAVYFREPREETAREVKFAGLVTQTAAIIIARHIEADLRRAAERALLDKDRLRID